jgi:Domain of unknown function (DUF4349)
MNTRVRRRAVRPAGAPHPERAAGLLHGRGMPAGITVTSCAVLLAGAGLLVAGCATASPAGTASSSSAGHVAFGSSGGSRAAAGTAAPAAPVAGPASAAGGSAAGGLAAIHAARLTQSAQSIIYTASLTIRVRDTSRAASSAVSEIAAAGGYTAAEQAQASRPGGQPPRVSLTLKVPVASYPAALSRLSALGRQTWLSQQSSDVTQQMADVNSLVTSQRDAIAQLQALLRRAGSVSDLLQVQQQISGDESTLEALQAQQRALDHETTYATISLLLLSPQPHAVLHKAPRHGFAAGLAAGWRGLRHATALVLTALGAVLPFAVVLAVLGGLGYAGWRRISRRRTRPDPAG